VRLEQTGVRFHRYGSCQPRQDWTVKEFTQLRLGQLAVQDVSAIDPRFVFTFPSILPKPG
jgi:hypothetical protein